MIEFRHYPEHNLLFSVFYGHVNADELNDLICKLEAFDTEASQVLGLTVLCRNAISEQIGASEIISAGERMRHVSFRKKGRQAIIAKSTLAWGFSRMYQFATDLFGQEELKVYRENGLQDALQWLGIETMYQPLSAIIDRCEQYPLEPPAA